MTANTRKEDICCQRDAGMDDYVSKPSVNPEALRKLLIQFGKRNNTPTSSRRSPPHRRRP